MTENKENKKEENKVKEILESVRVEYLDDSTVKLTHGIDSCVRKVHKFPQHLRGQE